MSRTDQKRAARIVGATMLSLFAAVAWLGYSVWSYPRRPLRPDDAHAVKLVVTRGMTPAAIGNALSIRGVIDHPSWFRFYATERGDAQKVRPGQYSFNAGMTPAQIMDALVTGVAEEEVGITIPEGKNFLEIAALMEEAGVCPAADFVRAGRDGALMRQLGVVGETFEGYLYPDRYLFRPATPAPKVIGRLVKHFREVYAELRAKHPAGIADLQKKYRFDDQQIVIMASLVEKETAEPVERPRIAGLFLNRLRLPTFVPHLLQTDPTIVYGCTVPENKSAACQKFEGRIRRAQLDDKENPYSTYAHEGLPPGPISNPGRAALEAVMEPETTPYLYFVSKNDGTHYFSRTRAEHEAAVDKYQRGK